MCVFLRVCKSACLLANLRRAHFAVMVTALAALMVVSVAMKIVAVVPSSFQFAARVRGMHHRG